MPGLRIELLKTALKTARFGVSVRAVIPTSTHAVIQQLKVSTGRNYRDICRVILETYVARSDNFVLAPLGDVPTVILNFRLSSDDASFFQDAALNLKLLRRYFFGRIIHEFLTRVPIKTIETVLKHQIDRVRRFIQEGKRIGTNKRRKSPTQHRTSHSTRTGKTGGAADPVRKPGGGAPRRRRKPDSRD